MEPTRSPPWLGQAPSPCWSTQPCPGATSDRPSVDSRGREPVQPQAGGSAMDFSRLFKTTFDQFVKGIVKLILFPLVGCLLCFTIVLIPTVMGGLIRGMLRYVREGIEPEFDELWCFDDFLQILWLVVLGGIAIAIGLALLVIPGLVLTVWWMYALFFIVDRKMTFIQAMGASRRLVTE